jgi:hypothetical protein
MLGLFGRSRRSSVRARSQRANLRIEALEERYCLTAPVLTLNAQVLPGHVARLTGSVTDNFLQGIRVNFGGAVSGNATTDANGNFLYETQNATLGTVNAVAIDQMNACSATMSVSLSTPAPTVTLNFSYLKEGNIQLTGSVTSVDMNLTVSFSGVATGSTTSDQNGNFSLITKPTKPGIIQAVATDIWGNTSNAGTVNFNPQPPTVTNFQGMPGPNDSWTFSGTVTAPETPNQLVHLGGFAPLTSQTVTVGNDGTFSVTVYLDSNASGWATAESDDWWGQQSNKATFFVC